jgi:hypothetical protein
MRYLTAAALTLVLAIPAFARHGGDPRDDLRRARAEIDAMESMLVTVRDPQLRGVLASRLNRVDSHLSSAERGLADVSSRGIDYGEASSMLRTARFDDERLEVIGMVARNGRFTVAEIQGLVRDFDFDSNRGEALILLYPACVDPQRYGLALGELRFSSTREDVRRRLRL